jgi:DNA replication protein DnaC
VIPDENCATCKGEGFLTDGGYRNCECRGIPKRDSFARPSEGWAGDALSSVLADAARKQAEREEHAKNCTERPCKRCQRFMCACGEPYDGPSGKCSACAEADRLAAAVAPVHASVPKHFRWALGASADVLAERVKAPRSLIERALANPPAGDMVLHGDTAVGKTSLAVAMLDRYVLQAPAERTGARLFEAYWLAGARARHALGQGEAPIVEAAMRASLLVLDDVGSEIDDRRNVIADVIFRRHNEDLPTWITTGFTPEQLMGRYGSQVLRRIVEHAKRVELGGKR